MPITITEALAELKTIDARLVKKREFVTGNLYRQNLYRDPLEKDGGAKKAIEQERQAIKDLEGRKVLIRRAIAKANDTREATVAGETRTIAEWLTWRRDVAPGQQKFLVAMKAKIDQVRREASQKQVAVTTEPGAANQNDIVVNISEKELAAEAEQLEAVLGTLDGQLSLKNATITIEV